MSDAPSAGGLVAGLRRRWSDLTSHRSFRVAVSTLSSIAILAVATIVYREAAYLDRFAEAVPEILREANLVAKDAAAVELTEKGTVTFEGRAVGNEAIAKQMASLYGVAGNLERSAEVTSLLLGFARPEWMPVPFADEPWLVLGAAALALAIVHFAVFWGLAGPLVGVAILSIVIAVSVTMLGKPSLAISLSSVPLGLLAFAIVIRGALAALDWASPVFAIACGVVREAMRLRIAVAFAAIAIVAIPLMPQWIDPLTPLRYQVQTYLARSMDTMYVVCAFLTVFLGCATVAFEIRDRQAWLTLTKPVSRISYLVGKWLGLVVLNACILLVATIAMFVFLVQLRARPAQDMFDALAVRDEVLVARVGTRPEYAPLPPAELQDAVNERLRADLNAQADLRDGTRSEIEIKKQFAREIAGDYLKQLRSIPPGLSREYRFVGLVPPKMRKAESTDAAKDGATDGSIASGSSSGPDGSAEAAEANLSLRYKFYSGDSDPHETYPVVFVLGEGDRQTWTDRKIVAAQSNALPVPASTIADDGTLVVRILNAQVNPNPGPGQPDFLPGRTSIAFDIDGLELLHRVGDFGPNLVRAQCVNLLKLSFLGMLAVSLASFLSFPVACLVVFTIFSAGSIAPYLATSVDEYRIRTESQALKAFEAVIKGIAGAVEFSVRSFGEASANGPLVEGRLVSMGLVLRTLALIGFAWSGVVLVLSLLVFRRKEIAIYSGQGG
ncbi:MAG: hypothetical protein ACKO3W_12890 [bacterium]